MRSLPDIETTTTAHNRITQNLIVVRLQGNDFRPFPVRALKQVSLHHAKSPVLISRIKFTGAPHPQDLPTIPILVGNILKITAPHGVRSTPIDRIAQKRMHVVLPLEVTFFQQIVIPAEIRPVVLILKLRWIVIHDGTVADRPMMGLKMNHRKLLRINYSLQEVKAVHHHVRGIDF